MGRWRERSRAEKYAFVQSQALFWGLYVVAIYLVATHLGVGVAILVFGGGLLAAAIGVFIGVWLKRRRGSP
jgi:small-conductance mechanosensitive channel